ncbi:MAG: patatin-like phospholipase family protein [Bacteroidota bacterium]
MNPKNKTGIVFSGGAARGIAHIGIIKALREQQVKIDCVAGTSAGSIVGAMFAAGLSVEQMIQFVKESSLLRIYEIGIPATGLTKLNYLKKQLAKYIKEDDFSILEIPLYIAATNLNTGLCDYFNAGGLFDAVMASASIPLIFKPVKINQSWYVDGGVLNNLPTEPLLENEAVDFLIGCNVMPVIPLPKISYSIALSIAARCSELQVASHAFAKAAQCDLWIEPAGLDKFPLYNFTKVDELVELGYQAALEAMAKVEGVGQN